VNNFQAMEARYQGSEKNQWWYRLLDVVSWYSSHALKKSFVQNSYRRFMSSTIKARSAVFVFSNCFFIIRNKLTNFI